MRKFKKVMGILFSLFVGGPVDHRREEMRKDISNFRPF